jgi:hypothetical protein
MGIVKGYSRACLRKITQLVTAITARASHGGYTTSRVHDRKGRDPMLKIILCVVAALVVTVGALTITDAGNDMASAPTMTTLPLQY